MVKTILIMLLLGIGSRAEDIYERSCVPCHETLPTSLQRMFMHYIQVYGGENNVKAGLKHYLKFPLKEISVMSDLFTDSYGIKQKTTLSDEELERALDIYWEKYKVIGRLK